MNKRDDIALAEDYKELLRGGRILVVSGPSGSGKTTLINSLRGSFPELVYSVSVTTRKQREGEEEGDDYFFVSVEKFREMIEADELAEWAVYCDNYYGTPKKFLMDTLERGDDIVLEIEVQGAMQIKEKFPQGVFIFVVPPSLEVLKQRLSRRGTEDIRRIKGRIERAKREMNYWRNYDYLIVNDELDKAEEELRAILMAERCRIR